MIQRRVPERPLTVVLVAACLVVTAAVSAVGASMDALLILLIILVGLAALAVAIVRPVTLFYAYCAAIPFNFVMPPGPAGTVARIAGAVFFIGYLIREPGSLRPNTIPVVGWLFVGWALVSTLWAINTETAFGAWLSLVQLFASTVLVASIVATNSRIARRALWVYAISATLTAVVGSFSYLESPALFLARAAVFPDQDPALFASLILPAAVFLMGEVQSREVAVPLRAVALAALVACVVALALSGTRSAWIALVVAVAVWLLIQREPRQILAVAMLAFGGVILVASVPGAGDYLFGRVTSSLATGGAGRTDIWAVGLGILASAPLIGAGFGNFSLAFTPYAIAHASAFSVAGGALFAGRAPHNALLGVSVETGVVGGVLLVAFLASALLQPGGDRIGNVVRVALVALFVQSMFLDILLQKQLWLFLAMAFGLAAARRLHTEPGAMRTPHGDGRRRYDRRTGLGAGGS